MWESCREKIEQMLKKDFADSNCTVYNSEEEYNKLLKSEIALMQLLSFFSAICILVCVSGFVSMVSLACKERRKSIAIRKIHGAASGDIFVIFVKEYAWLLFTGSAIAFSTGYFFMQRWLEHYVKHTGFPAWTYLLIFFVMALVIVLCVGHQVYKASIENPTEAIKTE